MSWLLDLGRGLVEQLVHQIRQCPCSCNLFADLWLGWVIRVTPGCATRAQFDAVAQRPGRGLGTRVVLLKRHLDVPSTGCMTVASCSGLQ
jgi:hypothetical protein